MVFLGGSPLYFVLINVFLLLIFNYSLSMNALLFDDANYINRHDFPSDFQFGAASSAFQYEGAWNEDGRGPSIWDTLTHEHPDAIADKSNADVTVDFYHLYREDVRTMKDMGMTAFRFSISWSRILPNGTLSGGINAKGIKFYSDLIDELMRNGLEPFATLFHWDTPQALEDAYGSFLNSRIVNDFRDFADVCFQYFGDRVKNWMTINEPFSYVMYGYGDGTYAPARCSTWLGCSEGDSSTEPYIVGHNILLAHAAGVDLYRRKYKESQNGTIGIAIEFIWPLPYSSHLEDINASQRSADFTFGWYMDPITNGDYPEIMKTLVGERLPKFTATESKMLKGSFDFLGLNYYTTAYAFNVPPADPKYLSYQTDGCVNTTGVRNGTAIGTPTASPWVYAYPMGIGHVLSYIYGKYNNPLIYLTENGVSQEKAPVSKSLNDTDRVEFLKTHLYYLHRVMREGVNVKGYFVWSLLDNFEWNYGYATPFGIYYVDFEMQPRSQRRIPKESAKWLKGFLRNIDDMKLHVSSM
ncbi:beta-glucosidase 24-like [Telopea speciosissima]|uniref:beta-glucosidase 24-like n=1 Tax=Telopea speciosissima TaxID=54955 RepID=UPI001CC3970F|nr:beta-glucosidase 24-like [Telopea speciosissima]